MLINKIYLISGELENCLARTTENKWTCEICSKVFSQKSSARRHIQTTHQGHQGLDCHICHGKYKNQTVLRSHMRQKHAGPGFEGYDYL